MARRLNKEEQARQDGIEYAYRMVKEKGIEFLEQRVSRNKKTIVPAFVNQKQLEEFTMEVKNNACLTFMTIVALTLRDEFGFGKKRLQQFTKRFTSLAESVSGNWCTCIDIIDVLEKEPGVQIIDVEGAHEILLDMDRQLAKARKQME